MFLHSQILKSVNHSVPYLGSLYSGGNRLYLSIACKLLIGIAMKKELTLLLFAAGVSFTLSLCNSSMQNQDSKVMRMQSKVTGKGRPIVLVGGGLTGWASWEPFVKGFSEKRTVISVQLLGVQFGLENRAL